VSCFEAGGEPLTGKLDSERRAGHVMIENCDENARDTRSILIQSPGAMPQKCL
jgi:hypothetical protein